MSAHQGWRPAARRPSRPATARDVALVALERIDAGAYANLALPALRAAAAVSSAIWDTRCARSANCREVISSSLIVVVISFIALAWSRPRARAPPWPRPSNATSAVTIAGRRSSPGWARRSAADRDGCC